MAKRSKRLPQMIARGFEIMLKSIPADALVNQTGAEEAIQRYRARPDNHLTSAFSDLLQEINPCIDSKKLQETDVDIALLQVKADLKSWSFQ